MAGESGVTVGGQLRLGRESLGAHHRPDSVGGLAPPSALTLRVQFLQRGQCSVHIGDVLFQHLDALGHGTLARGALGHRVVGRWAVDHGPDRRRSRPGTAVRVASDPVTSLAMLVSGITAGPLAQLDPDNPPEGLGRLALFFVLALVITAPFALRTVRKVRSGTWRQQDADAGTTEADAQPAETDEGRVEDLIEAIRALEGDHSGRAYVLVRRHLTSQGREVAAPLAATLVHDALSRSGWKVAEVVPDELGVVWECEPRGE